MTGPCAQETQNLCMSTHEESDKIAVMIESGAIETAALLEKFESYPYPIEKATASSAAGKQTEDIVNAGQRYIPVVDDHGTESWAKFQKCRGLGQNRI